MRKIILLFIAALSLNAQAQITITTSDMPVVNDTFRLSTTGDLWGIDPTLTGANYTWSYPFLAWATQNVDTCVSVGSTPLAYQFFFNNIILYPANKADYAIRGQDFSVATFFSMTDVYDFYKVDGTGFKNVGFGANINGIPASVRNNPVDLIYKLPLNYLDVYNNYSEYQLSVPGVFTYNQKKWRSATADGWGTLTTPYGTFQTLRVKFLIDITDSIVVDTLGINQVIPRPTETQYHWLAAGEDVPILQINETGGFITTIVYKDSATSSSLGMTEHEPLPEFALFPNPASSAITVMVNGADIRNVIFRDLSGRIALSVNASNHTQTLQLDVAAFPSGMYEAEIMLADGRRLNRPFVKH